jgi:hypothetical protein
MDLGDLNTVADVTQMLHDLLDDDLDVSLNPPGTLPEQNGGGNGFAAVNLFLYQVSENGVLKNQPNITRADGVQELPPLVLDLYYLLTPYANDTLSAHRVLTHAMQRLYVNTTIEGAALPGPLRLVMERLTINLCQMSLEELTRIWNALQTPYRLSVTYQVRAVKVPSLVEKNPERVRRTDHVFSQR